MRASSGLLQRPWRLIGWLCIVAGLYATYVRFTRGLGAATNLNDDFPWGLWVGFDVVCGVGLAAGGFTISPLFTSSAWKSIARLPSRRSWRRSSVT